jgi:hypothetical protein
MTAIDTMKEQDQGEVVFRLMAGRQEKCYVAPTSERWALKGQEPEVVRLVLGIGKLNSAVCLHF